MPRFAYPPIAACLLGWLSGGAPSAHAAGDTTHATSADAWFDEHVRPLLATRCWTCHGPKAESGLRLDSREGVLAGGKRGPAIVVGRPEESLLMTAVRRQHDTLKMPPNGALGVDDVAAFERWIRDGAPWPLSEAEIFHRQIWPLLQRACLACHGDDDPENGLRIDSRDALLKGGKSGPAIKPGSPDGSLMIQAVRWTHAEFEMPLEKKLPPHEIALLEAWVARGAPWPPPEARVVADGPRKSGGRRWRPTWWAGPPRVAPAPTLRILGRRARNEIDRFVLARLETLGIEPVAAAGRRAWLRRASFTLTGTVPDAATIDAFVKDPADDRRAQQAIADRLLGAANHGAHWARIWLRDVLPQGELPATLVAEVADAFNRDMPFDAFVRTQLSSAVPAANPHGGERDKPTLLTLAAAQPDPDQRPADARVAVLGRAFLGMTLDCARCHDHPTDPVRHSDHLTLVKVFGALTGPTGTRDEPPDVTTLFSDLFGTPTAARDASQDDPRAIVVARLTGADNPLLARVLVNRVWQHHFGQGLVATLDDFGARGETPSHRELLDDLAARFVANGWSLKWLHRQIVLSASFGLAAMQGKEQAARDPDNVFLWRANPRVIDDEAVRDAWNALAPEDTTRPRAATRGTAVATAASASASGTTAATAIASGATAASATPTAVRDRVWRQALASASATRSDVVLASAAASTAGGAALDKDREKNLERSRGAVNNKATGGAEMELSARAAEVRSIYRIVLGREPDGKELDTAVAFLRGKHGRGPALAEALMNCNEFRFLM